MLLVTLSIITIIILKDNKQKIKLDNVKLNEVKDTKGLALMLEQTNGTYEETINTEWPTDGYSFNKHMSGCIDSNGNTIENTLSYKNGAIKLKTKHNTYCYIYFDIDRAATEELLATVEEEQLWNSTLEDDGYRYVGTNPDNYICFGTNDQEECMNDTDKYMYRIIGIFEDENGVQHIKLIKKEALNTAYAWNKDYQNDVDWEDSDLYKGINGSYFATNSEYFYMQDSAWNNLIAIWNYTATNTKTYENYAYNGSFGVYYYAYNTIKTIYLHEMNRSSKSNQTCYYDESTIVDCNIGEWNTVSAKVGLMYVSDYLLSLGKAVLEYKAFDDMSTLKTGWMHLTQNDSNNLSTTSIDPPNTVEWTMLHFGWNGSSIGYYAWTLNLSGAIGVPSVRDAYSVRPVFYLESNTKLDKGTGTIEDPYTIETSPNLREYCEEYNNINECIQNEENNIEEVCDLWNSALEEDGIRYVGTNPNNYVCFGTTNEEECKNDTDKYMYRIIGIFEDTNGDQHLKLIKNEALNTTYRWHNSESDVDWDESDLYKGINGSCFSTNNEYSYMQDSGWNNLIATWNYTATNTKTQESSGMYYNNSKIKNIYLHEMNRSAKTSSIGQWKPVASKISLMYTSDYLLSLGETLLDYSSVSNYSDLLTSWMHITNNDSGAPSEYEWTSSRFGYDGLDYTAWYVSFSGDVYYADVYYDFASVRPVFYLTENIKITSGKGSINEPFIIN